MDQPSSSPQPSQPHQPNTGMAVVAYILFFVPLLTSSKNDPFVKFHVKQGLVLFIIAIISMVISYFGIMGAMLAMLINIFLLIMVIIGIVNAVQGKQQPLPLVGQFGEQFKF